MPRTFNINLSPQLEALVRKKVASGRYTSASEVIREGLRLLEANDRLQSARLERLRQEVREGTASGPAAPWDMEGARNEGRKRLGGSGRRAVK